MSSPNVLCKSSLEILEDSVNYKLSDFDRGLENNNNGTCPANVSLPESSESLESEDIRTWNRPRLDRTSKTSVESSTTDIITDSWDEPVITHENQYQIDGSIMRDAFRSGTIEIESISPDLFESVDENGCNLLQIAVDSAHRNTVSLLLDKDIDMESRDSMGQTALHHSITRADTDIIQLLLECGANMEAVSHNGSRPLWMAANLGIESAAKHLIEFDANIDSFNAFKGTTALFEAVKLGNIPIVQMLLDNGADVDVRMAPAQPVPPSSPADSGPHIGLRGDSRSVAIQH